LAAFFSSSHQRHLRLAELTPKLHDMQFSQINLIFAASVANFGNETNSVLENIFLGILGCF